jgi:N-carbamoylputrescine amidase
VNRIGHEKPYGGEGIEFWGQSFIAGTSGELLAKASSDREEKLVVELDMAQLDETRTVWPFFRDRRIDAYEGITRRWGA